MGVCASCYSSRDCPTQYSMVGSIQYASSLISPARLVGRLIIPQHNVFEEAPSGKKEKRPWNWLLQRLRQGDYCMSSLPFQSFQHGLEVK
jgi:hypothetical protein